MTMLPSLLLTILAFVIAKWLIQTTFKVGFSVIGWLIKTIFNILCLPFKLIFQGLLKILGCHI